MNWYTILGLIFVAGGTVLMTYGGVFQARADGKTAEDKLEKISRDLADLKGKPKVDLSDDAISRVEGDIQKWAEDFASAKQRKKLLIDKKISEHQTDAEHIASMGRSYFAYALSVLRTSLQSYASKTGAQLKIDLPEVQERLFFDPDVNYLGEVVFREGQRWQVVTLTTHDSVDIAPPMIVIKLLNSGSEPQSVREKGELMLRFSRDMKTFFVRFQQDFRLAVSEEHLHEPTTSYEHSMKSILLKLVEFQVLQD